MNDSDTEPVRVVCGFDLGGTKLGGIVVDAAGLDPLHEDRLPSPTGLDGVLDAITDLRDSLLKGAVEALGRPVELAAVGLGAPGLVDRSGTLRFGANLPGVVDAPLADLLRERLGVPVAVDNDATCAAWAEHERGAAVGANHSMTITLGTGIGAGITVKGEILRGAHGFAGEPGHMVVDPHGPRCPCGRRGCWERFGSGSGLGRLAREAAESGNASRLLELAGGEIGEVKGELVTRAAAEGDEEALAVIREFAWWVALGIANLVNVLDSELVVIGGGLADAGDLLLDPVRSAYRDLVLGADHRDEVPIVVAKLGSRAGAWGAALLALARLEV
ncbi:MAG: ROK family protein [Acidimicrobiales bacterium]|nr:ROK family protein [Acidimicrobiales bacterium]